MTPLRTSLKTLERIAEVVKIKNPWEAVCGAVDLIENHYRYEEKVPTRFDSGTGKPVQFTWKPYEKFRSEVLLNWDYKNERPLRHESSENDISLSQEVVDFLFENGIRNHGILIETPYGNYALNYDETSYDASAHNDRWTQTDRKIRFIPLTKKLTKKSIEGGERK